MALVTGSGRVVRVGRRLAGGGQGEVFEVHSARGVVFKKYLVKALSSDPALERRLRAMVARPPAEWREQSSGHVTLAWPSDVVLADGRFAGFLMPTVDMGNTVGLHRITNPTDRRDATGLTSWAQGFTWQYLVRAAANLAHVTRVLHQSGVVVGDFNESNVRVSREARVTLLDCDSMQISDPSSGQRFFCPVGRPEFTPPELLNANWAKTVRHPSSDLFALAIHLYQLLLEGEHPFRGLWSGPGDKPSVAELARQGIWAHQRGGPLSPRPAAIGISLLPDSVVRLFRSAFEDGATNPAARPTALQWHEALTGLEAGLRRCKANQAHLYPRQHRSCPWCQRASAGSQRGPAAGFQLPLPPAVVPLRPSPPAAPLFAQPAATNPGRGYAAPSTSRPAASQAMRRGREAPRRRVDKRVAILAALLATTVAAPLTIGNLVWRNHLAAVSQFPPPDLRAIPGGAGMLKYGPEYLFGVLVLAGFLGLILLRPPWTRTRAPIALTGLVLLGAAGLAPWAGNTAANRLGAAGWHAYDLGPIPVKVLGDTCGEYWTSDLPVKGAYQRWVLTGDDGSGDCSTLTGYAGWHRTWQKSARNGTYFSGIAAYGNNVLIAVKLGQNSAGHLFGFNETSGRFLWRWGCPGAQSIQDVVFHGAAGHAQYPDRYAVVTCQDPSGNDKTFHVIPHRH